MNYQNYAMGKWVSGDGDGTPLFNAITGTEIGSANSKGLDFGQMMDYSRKVGSPTLRKMTFQQRGLMLKALALHLHGIKGKFYDLSAATPKLIHGLTLKGESVIFLLMRHCENNSPIFPFMWMVRPQNFLKKEHLWVIILWCRRKGWSSISMPSIFLYGVCWKKLR